jgi:hypothetical protein
MTDPEVTSFSSILDKYSRFLTRCENRKDLLNLGHRLFVPKIKLEIPERPSYNLLHDKEKELSLPPLRGPGFVRTGAPRSVAGRGEAPMSAPDQLAEEVMLIQDRNAVLLARSKAIANQRDGMKIEHGRLMECSIQQKVKLRSEVQKLKNELAQALANSRPVSSQRSGSSAASSRKATTQAVLDELSKLNNAILLRIHSFKISISCDPFAFQRTVMHRYKPEMERFLGQIYAHSEFLPIGAVIEKFNEISDSIDKEIKGLDIEIRNEHERNELLQREAKQLADEMDVQQNAVDLLRKQNAKSLKRKSLARNTNMPSCSKSLQLKEQCRHRHVQWSSLLDLNPNYSQNAISEMALEERRCNAARKDLEERTAQQ